MSVHSPGVRLNHHEKLFTGEVFYVDAAQADNTGSGLSPEAAKKTITAAVGAASAAGDAIMIKAGTYTETELNINKPGLELWFEIGAVLDPASDTALTISAGYCLIHGNLDITPAAGQIGILIANTANYCVIEDVAVITGGTGYHIIGSGTLLKRCAAGLQTVIGFDIDGAQTRLIDCTTVGNSATVGYNISNSADIGVLNNCTSVGHETAGFNIDAGCMNWTIKDCSSGGADGARIDAGSANMWANFSDTLRRDQHTQIYPFPDGEGVAGDPITLVTDANDKTNGAASTANYWGEPMVLIAPGVITARWEYTGNNIYATTTNKAFRGAVYRIVNDIRAVRDAGNAWDEGATALTFDDVFDLGAGDLVWITSSAHKPNGEIVRITDVTGAVVTIEREASQFGGANTGLRWDHSTNVGAGTLYAYLCWRDESQYHASEFDYSAGSAKDFSSFFFHKQRGMNANSGLIARLQNSTDGTNGAGLDMTVCYKD